MAAGIVAVVVPPKTLKLAFLLYPVKVVVVYIGVAAVNVDIAVRSKGARTRFLLISDVSCCC